MKSKLSTLICKHKHSQRPQCATVSLGKSWFITESHIKTWKPSCIDDGVLTKYLAEGAVVSFSQQIWKVIWKTILVMEFGSFLDTRISVPSTYSLWKEPSELFPLARSFSLHRLYSFLYLIVTSQVTAELNLNHNRLAVPALQAWMAYFILFVLSWCRCAGVRL